MSSDQKSDTPSSNRDVIQNSNEEHPLRSTEYHENQYYELPPGPPETGFNITFAVSSTKPSMQRTREILKNSLTDLDEAQKTDQSTDVMTARRAEQERQRDGGSTDTEDDFDDYLRIVHRSCLNLSTQLRKQRRRRQQRRRHCSGRDV